MSERALSSVILITGGTGSFGHAFVAYALRQGVQEVRVLSRDEFKQEIMRKELHDPRSSSIWAMCGTAHCSFVSIDKETEILKKYRPENTWGKIVKVIESCARKQ